MLLLLEPLLLIFLFHLPSDVPVGRLLGIPLLLPHKRLIGVEVGPILIELQDLIDSGFGVAKPLILPLLGDLLDQVAIGLPLLILDILKHLPIDHIKPSLLIIVAFEAGMTEVHPNVKAKSMHLDVLFAHLVFIEQDFLAVGVVPGTLVRVRKGLIGLLHENEQGFGLLVPGVLVRVVFQGHFTVALSGNQRTVLMSAALAFLSTSSTS